MHLHTFKFDNIFSPSSHNDLFLWAGQAFRAVFKMAPLDQLRCSEFLGLKWQKDNTSVENLECKSTNTNGSVCTVWFQVSNRLYYSCYHLSIRGLRQWNFCIYHVTRQLLEHFCKLHSAKMRHIVEYAEVTVTGNSLVWSTMLHYFFMNFFALRCSREELELTKVT